MKNVGDLLTDEFKNNETEMIKAKTISRIDEYETKLGPRRPASNSQLETRSRKM